MVISPLPSNYANAVTPYVPVGRQPVGEENAELKNTTFKPLEEGASSARSENRRSPEDNPNEVDERERTRQPNRDPEQQAKERQQQQELEQISELAARDREVRNHERAHTAVGGQYASAPRYEYTRGPDGVNYATAGEVSIDTSKIPGDPRATLEKAQQIRRAAMAPAEPSPQDRRVAAEATRIEAEARAELAQLMLEQAERPGRDEDGNEESTAASVDDNSREQRQQTEREESAREENARQFAEMSIRNIENNRKLIEIGLARPPINSGQFFNQQV
ncbi:MAG TPA: putative metalloprotease CJM1_0395 family protein [Cellvibrionaceae bacterium]